MKRHLPGMNFRLTVYEAPSTVLVVAMPGCEAPSTGHEFSVDGHEFSVDGHEFSVDGV